MIAVLRLRRSKQPEALRARHAAMLDIPYSGWGRTRLSIPLTSAQMSSNLRADIAQNFASVRNRKRNIRLAEHGRLVRTRGRNSRWLTTRDCSRTKLR